MFKIEIYEDQNGNSEIAELLYELNKRAKSDKSSRIRLKKITEYFKLLQNFGFKLGFPFIKHIADTELWELRPTSDRIFFVYWKEEKFVLLHHFVKKSQKTPKHEIDKAIQNLKDFLGR